MQKPCPNSWENGCRCVDHADGLMQYAPDVQAFLAWLKQADREKAAARLAAVPTPERENTYSYGDKPQPWQPRPARHLREAA